MSLQNADEKVNLQASASRPWLFIHALRSLSAFKALHHREYRLLWYGQIFASMGQWMDDITRSWLIYTLTDSALQLGLVRGVQIVPLLLLSPVAGSVADRYSRKTQLVVAQVVNAIVYAATALLIFTGLIRAWHIYVTAFIMAIVQTFQQPARASMVADAVPADSLTNAIGLNATIHNLSRSTGPALAGLLIAVIGTGGTYAVQAAFYMLATLWTVQLRLTRRNVSDGGEHASHKESFGRSIVEGWLFCWRDAAVRTGLLTVMFANLFIVPFVTLLPVYARDLLHVGSTGQGLLVTTMGLGALCSAVLIASAGDKLPRGILMLGSVTLYGLVIMVFAVSPWFQLSLLAMGLAGLCHVHSHALVQTVIQSYSPSEFRGRTMAMFHMSRMVMMTGGMLIGALSTLWGARWAVASMGVTGTLVMIALYVFFPQARRIR